MTISMGTVCSGIGSFDLAAEECGVQVLWQSEIDKFALSVLQRHFPNCQQLGDIRHVNQATAVTPDILVGGTPCQDLSRSGSRQGLGGAKSSLFWEYVRVIQELRPAIAVWENVDSALSSNAGRDFAAVLTAFHECGARDIAWRVLNSQHFGVPQRRRRVFLVADFRGERAGQILFEPASAYRHPTTGSETRQTVAGALTRGNQAANFREGNTYIPITARTITTGVQRHSDDGTRQTLIPITAYALTTKNRLSERSQDTFVPVTAAPLNTKVRFSGDLEETLVPTHLQSAPLLSGTLTASGAGLNRASGQENELDFIIPAITGVRRLTPRECERLQGFPDDYTRYGHDGREMSDTARYSMLGNSITKPVAQWITERCVKSLG